MRGPGWVVVLIVLVGCQKDVRTPAEKVVGVVAAATPEATQAGVEILRAGGNAVDAAVAVAFALDVTEPAGSGLAGQTFVLVHPPGGPAVVVNGTTLSPRATPRNASREDLVGRRAATIPSQVRVLETAWKRFGSGRITWDSLLQPAIRFAREGFAPGPFRKALFDKYHDALSGDPSTNVFGTRTIRQPELANTLERLAGAGADDFYTGRIGRMIASDMEANDGWITFEDLSGFPDPKVEPALKGTFRDWTIYTLPPPAGGWVVLRALNTLEAVPDREFEDAPVKWMAEALRDAHRTRVDSPITDLQKYAPEVADRTAKIAATKTVDDIRGDETTHFSIIDADGLAVSVTQSLNSFFGAKVMHPELGFLYNNYMIEFVTGNPDHTYAIRPGAMPYSSMSATILARDGEARLALGSPGSRRIISAVVQVAYCWAARGQPIENAVAAPRIHVIPERNELLVEPGAVRGPLSGLERRRFKVLTPLSSLSKGGLNPYFGGVHAVAFEKGRGLCGAADPRRDGSVGFALDD